ncbi:MAG: PEP-CTERM sorting domain-containing protein [Fimbriimonadaceae bacterium]|nr:PEP-CTERM sorting domain-containing protein [Fimbriimonadaceae bacterium]QYK54978.1 MAG: PEP-CTERM sorting domain-containing protein [Fimbriimonadaceae bacterium]
MAKFGRTALFSLLAGLTTAASAQIVNGDFETGSLGPWVVGFTSNGATQVQDVVRYDIDGPGPKGTNFASRFQVGNANTPNQQNQGVIVTQNITLIGGTNYTLSFDYSSFNFGASNNADGGYYAVFVNGSQLGGVETGAINVGASSYGSVNANFLANTTGVYQVGFVIGRDFLSTASIYQYVDNFEVVPEPATMLVLGSGLAALAARRRKV